MNKVSMVGFGEIKSKKYGTVKIIKRKDVCGAYFVIGKTEKKKLAGLVSKDGKEIIPLCESVLEDYNINEDNKNAYLGFKYEDSPNLEYYIIKNFNGNTGVVNIFGRKNDVSITFRKTNIKCNVWPIEMHTELSSYVLYNFIEDRIITFPFNCLLDVEEKNLPHKFYYEVNVASNYQEDGTDLYVVHSTLCGYLDENGYMSSKVLDSDSLNTYKFNKKLDTASNEFKNFLNQLTLMYAEKYKEKEEKILDSMERLLVSDDPYIEKQKVIKFKPDRKKV